MLLFYHLCVCDAREWAREYGGDTIIGTLKMTKKGLFSFISLGTHQHAPPPAAVHMGVSCFTINTLIDSKAFLFNVYPCVMVDSEF